jgi:hypothetical protein
MVNSNMSTPAGVARRASPRWRIQQQRGSALIFALMTLVALMLAAVALVRSVDTSSRVLGNLGFKQEATAAAGSRRLLRNLVGRIGYDGSTGPTWRAWLRHACRGQLGPRQLRLRTKHSAVRRDAFGPTRHDRCEHKRPLLHFAPVPDDRGPDCRRQHLPTTIAGKQQCGPAQGLTRLCPLRAFCRRSRPLLPHRGARGWRARHNQLHGNHRAFLSTFKQTTHREPKS